MNYFKPALLSLLVTLPIDAYAQSAKEVEDFFNPKVAEYNQILEQNLEGYKIDWQIDSTSFVEFSGHKKISVSVGKNVLDAVAGYAIGRDGLINFYKENLQKVVFVRKPIEEAEIEYRAAEKALYLTSDYDDVINQKPIWDYIYENVCAGGVCVYEFFYLETIAKHREGFNKELSDKHGTTIAWEIDHVSFRAHAPHHLLPAFGTAMREVLYAFTRHADDDQWKVISSRIQKVSFIQKENVDPTFSVAEGNLILTSDFRRKHPGQGEIWEYLLKNVVNGDAK
ncbi:hypothetical protein [Kiloniella sp. EL199]|uniref:hypothetical protein n=1 Tax=Kiloniella sp. EL199 TaxID=2107581 RepID=UPI000EA2BB52|nr:hypothetical protein [Kiloniella sp. EL199]